MLNLNEITLVCIDCIDPTRLIKPFEMCLCNCHFGSVKLLTHIDYHISNVKTIKIPKILSVKDHSYFLLKELYRYIDTPFCLCIQHDGFILNPKAWINEFFDYDYIGAVWEHEHVNKIRCRYTKLWNVGNGGFSFRSKKLLKITSEFDLTSFVYYPEDVFIGRDIRRELELKGIKYAPEHLANKFSKELGTWEGQFGFHDFRTDLTNFEKSSDTKDSFVKQRIMAKVNSLKWYHNIDLGQGIITPGRNFNDIWENIRKTRKHIEYRNKSVLDIGSYDGMWAFEAEKLKAKLVIATDCNYESFENFLFCREILKSNVIPFYNISLYTLFERLDAVLQSGQPNQNELFDIVQYLGVFYHLRDPLLSLLQVRSCLKDDGYMLFETSTILNDNKSAMFFNGIFPNCRIYDDYTTWWTPTVLCLMEMLKVSFFEPIEHTINIIPQNHKNENIQIGRICIVAKAIPKVISTNEQVNELFRTFRNVGLN